MVLVLDFSASILVDKSNRNRFAGALDEIASYIDRTTGDLVLGDATVSIARFATTAEEQPHCTQLNLKGNYRAVADLANCLRTVATAYRRGIDPLLTRRIGIDTNYVAAMAQAGKMLPPKAIRPAIVFFTDGEHDARGVPVATVLPERNRLFGNLSPFALLPVGMGLKPENRAALEKGLERLESIRAMEACAGAPEFQWPKVVFESPVAAGQAVARALGQVTCSAFTTPTPTPTPAPTPVPTPTPIPPRPPSQPRNVGVTAGDEQVVVTWLAPVDPGTSPIVDYLVQCRPGSGGDVTWSTEGVSTAESAVVPGLVNDTGYVCEVAAANAAGTGVWSPLSRSTSPYGRPSPPAKPTAEAKDKSVVVSVPAVAGATDYRFDCSSDGGSTWPINTAAGSPQRSVAGLTNDTEYVCRGFAANDHGTSDASPVSDSVRPCGSIFECNPVLLPIAGIVLLLILLALLFMLARWYIGRAKAYITAQVDDFPAVNLGRGPQVGFGFIRSSPSGPVQDVIVDGSSGADVRVRYRGGNKFEVRSGARLTTTATGRTIEVIDNENQAHAVVLRATSVRPRPPRPVEDDSFWRDAGSSPMASGLAPDQSWD